MTQSIARRTPTCASARCALSALGLLAAVGAASPADAVVTYELRDQVLSGISAFASSNFPLSFTVSDAAVSRGSLSVRGSGFSTPNEPATSGYTGDVADLVLLSVDGSVQPPSFDTYRNREFNLAVLFGADQSVSSFSLDWQNSDQRVRLRDSGGGGLVRGAVADEGFPGCGGNVFLGAPGACFVTGRIQQVGAASPIPEPASLALLGIGLLGCAAVRHRPGQGVTDAMPQAV